MAVADHYDTTNSTVFIDNTQIGYIDPKSIPFPKGTTAKKDTTTLNSGYIKSNAAGWFDPGDATFTGNWFPSDLGQQALKNASIDRLAHTITINVPLSGQIFTWTGIVGEMWPSSNADNTQIFNCKIFAQGMATVSAAWAPITKIEVGGASASYFPSTISTAVVNTTTGLDRYAIISEINATSSDYIKVTAAASTYIGITYDGGVTWITLVSGASTGNSVIPVAYYPAAGKIMKATVCVQQVSTTAPYYADHFIDVYLTRDST